MQNLAPISFHQVLAGIFSICVVSAFILTFKKSLRTHAIRMLTIMFIGSLAMLANNAFVYFASVFIIATAITETEFLQDLAAIIKGGKEYFKYKKELLSNKEVLDKIKKETSEQAEISKPDKEKPEIMFEKSENAQKAWLSWILKQPGLRFAVEQSALTFIERQFGKPMQRNMRLKKRNLSADYDGILINPHNEPDMVFEIKLLRASNFKWLEQKLSMINEHFQKYKEITNRKAEFWLILVVDSSPSFKESTESYFANNINKSDFNMGVKVYTFQDIGLI